MSLLFAFSSNISGDERALNKTDRAVVFAIQEEISANHLAKKSDCVSFDLRTVTDEAAVRAELKHRGVKVSAKWRGSRPPHALVFLVLTPIREEEPDKYGIEIGFAGEREVSGLTGIFSARNLADSIRWFRARVSGL